MAKFIAITLSLILILSIVGGVFYYLTQRSTPEPEQVTEPTDDPVEEVEELEPEPVPAPPPPPEMQSMSFGLYFIVYEKSQESVVRVSRSVSARTEDGAELTALNELLKGPKSDEGLNLETAIPKNTVLKSLLILPNGTAEADFNQTLHSGVSGSAQVSAIREQIEKTLLQFSTINSVIISVDGESEEVLQP